MQPGGKRRVGIFGGTFDPVHQGHLLLAEQCREQAQLDQVWFVPAARPPHKADQALTPFAQRVEMLALATAGHPAFRIEELERDRPGASYTVDTLETLHARHPDHELFLLLGSDCLPDLPTWREPRRILQLVTLLVVARPGWPLWSDTDLAQALGLPAATSVRQQVAHIPLFEVSSRDLRRRVAAGQSIRYLVPRAVEEYIAGHGLYRGPAPETSSSPVPKHP